MRILENPNPVQVHLYTLTCQKCLCKFECTNNEIKHKSWSDANGRLGGTHHFSTMEYVNCPNCGEQITVSKQSGYSSSMIGDYHITENYHI